MLNALCISDLQAPFEHKHAFDFVCHVKKTFFDRFLIKPYIVNMGDEVDQHTLSTFAKSPKALGAKAEFDEAKLHLSPWFKEFPKTYVCISNHTYRVYKRAGDVGIPEAFMKTIGEAYEAPVDWRWQQKWIQGGVCFEHGENVSGPTAALNAAIQNQMPTVIGHQHSHASVMYRDSEFGQLWGMNTGCLIDVTQYAFDYGKTLRIKPTLGCGVILNGVPYFVPMWLDHQGNWVGRI